MSRASFRVILCAFCTSLVSLTSPSQSDNSFVTRSGTGFTVNGQRFGFGGTNSYNLPWASPFLLNSTLGDAHALGLRVMRTYASVQIGDPSAPHPSATWFSPEDFLSGEGKGVYFQSWDQAAGRMVINQGSTGLNHLDAVIAAAARHHMRLVLALVDSWNYHGGSVQYCAWHHLPSVTLPNGKQAWCPSFYTDPSVRADFKTWIAALLNRRNTKTGVVYKDDPTIMTWELANEPMPDVQILSTWATEMADFIRTIDRRHLISIGTAGFFQNLQQYAQLLDIPSIDYGTLHMYPVFRQPASTPSACIPILQQYLALGTASHKPIVLEEFGWSSAHPAQADVYRQWTDVVWKSGIGGWQFWYFSGHNSDGSIPPADGEGFEIYRDGSATSKVLSDAALKIAAAPNSPNPR